MVKRQRDKEHWRTSSRENHRQCDTQKDFDRVHSRFFDYWTDPVLWAYAPTQVLLKDGSSDESFFFHVVYAEPEMSSALNEDGQVFASPLFRLFTPLLARIGCTTPLRLRAIC